MTSFEGSCATIWRLLCHKNNCFTRGSGTLAPSSSTLMGNSLLPLSELCSCWELGVIHLWVIICFIAPHYAISRYGGKSYWRRIIFKKSSITTLTLTCGADAVLPMQTWFLQYTKSHHETPEKDSHSLFAVVVFVYHIYSHLSPPWRSRATYIKPLYSISSSQQPWKTG